MSVAFILNPGYNTINNVHHTFWDQDLDNIKNTSLNQELTVTTSVSAPNHIITGGTLPAQLYMQPDGITLATDAPQFQAPILLAPTSKLQLVDEFEPTTGVTFSKDIHMTYDTTASNIDGVGELTCNTLNYTTLNPPITPGDASTWSEYPATQDVNMNLFNLNNAGFISCYGIPSGDISLQVSGQSIAPLHKTTVQLTTLGDNDTIPSIDSSISLNSLVTSLSQPNNWESDYGATVVKSAPASDIVLSGSRVALTSDNSVNALVRNSSGAVSFNSDFNSNSPLDHFGSAGQIVQSNGDAAPPSWVDAPSASNWSEYPATQDVDLADNSLINKSSNTVQAVTQIFKVLNFGVGSASYPAQVLVTSSSDNAATSAQVQLYTGINDVNVSSLTQYPLAATGTAYSGFGSNSGSLQLLGSGNDLALVPGNYFSGEAGKVRLAYNKSLSAVTLNNAGALSFNSDWSSGTPVDGDFGTAGQIVQSNGDAAPPSWVAAPTASNWSTFAATSDVDFAGHSLTDTTGPVKVNKQLLITNTDNKQTKIISLLSPIDDPSVPGSISISSNTGFGGANVVQLASYPVGATSTNFASRSGVVVSSTNEDASIVTLGSGGSVRLGYSSGTKAVTVNPNGALCFNSSYSGSVMTEGNFGNSGYVLKSSSSTNPPTWTDVNSLINGTDNVFYVSKNGLDTNKGNISSQKLTIQSAITAATLSYPQQVVILIAPGVYTEALSITRPNITLLGYSPSSQQNLLTQIVGNVSIACTASQDLYYSQVGIFNLHISGSVIDTSTVVHTLNIEQCRISNNGQIFWQNSSADNRTRLEQVTLLHASTGSGTAPLMQFSSGMATLGLLDVTGRDNAPLLQFDGTALLSVCALSTFESTTASATAAPIVYIALANGGSAPLTQKAFAFGYNSFSYSTPVSRAFSSGKNCGIVTNSTTGNARVIITYNAFNLLLCDATCFCVSDVNKSTPAKATSVSFFSNCSTYLATGIDVLSGNKSTFAAVA